MVQHGVLPAGRSQRVLTMMSARDAYKAFGALLIRDGRHVTDDYDEDAALASRPLLKPGDVVPDARGAINTSAELENLRRVSYAPENRGRGPAATSTASTSIRPEIASFPSQTFTRSDVETIYGGSGRTPFYLKAHPKSAKRKFNEIDWMLVFAQNVMQCNRHLIHRSSSNAKHDDEHDPSKRSKRNVLSAGNMQTLHQREQRARGLSSVALQKHRAEFAQILMTLRLKVTHVVKIASRPERGRYLTKRCRATAKESYHITT